MALNMIAAFSIGRVIGFENEIPWHIPEDLKRFKELTTGTTVVMGRKTYESIRRPLPKRKNIVLTRDKNWTADGVEVIHDYKDVLGESGDVFIIGGEEVYRVFLSYTDKLYLTVVHEKFEGDAYFPDFDLEKEFELIESIDCINDKGLKYSYMNLQRADPEELKMKKLFPGFEFSWIEESK